MNVVVRLAALALVTVCATYDPANAAEYPNKPVRLVVPFPPAGAADILARGLTPKLSSQLRQQVIVDNRPGANGVIGFDVVSKAPADGYTLLLGFTTGVAVNPVLIAKIPYDPVKSFAPVGMLARTPMVLIASPAFKAGSVQELIAIAKASPGKVSYGSPGAGNPNHLAAELFKLTAGIELVHVPYKGAALVMTDVMAGHVPTGFVTLAAALPQLRSGKLKALAVTSDKRSAAAPTVATMAEAGVPGLVITEWFGILAPSATPKPVVALLNREIASAAQSTEVQARFSEQGLEPMTMTSDAFANVIRSDIAKMGEIIRKAGIRAGDLAQ